MPYVYHEAKTEAVIPTKSEKMGTELASTNAIALAEKHSATHTNQPMNVCV